MFSHISQRIHSFGPGIIPYLEAEWEQSVSNIVQSRIEQLIHGIHFEQVYTELGRWQKDGGSDLLRAWLTIDRLQYPDLDEEEVHNKIGLIRKDIWIELSENLTALEQVRLFNHIFFQIHNFSGNKEDYHALENSFLCKVLDRRKGNPLSISLLYMLIAQSLDIPIAGINLPSHFILAYTRHDILSDDRKPAGGQVLFYINAYSGGAVFSYDDLEIFLAQQGLEPNPAFTEPCRNSDIIFRMLNNLHVAYNKHGMSSRVKEIEQLRKLFGTAS